MIHYDDTYRAVAEEMESEADERDTDLQPSTPIWPEPKPVQSVLLPVLSISDAMIPQPLRPWLNDIAYRMRCPIDYVASAAIVMLSSLIGTRLAIKPKARDDWTIIPNLWGAVIGDPSTMKTPSVGEVFKPLNRLIMESRNQYEEELQRYQAEQLTYEAQKKVYQSQEQARLKGKPADNPVGFPEEPQKPTERRYMTNDATVEKIGDLLNQNPDGLLQFRDELIGLLAGWERAGREQDRAFYLEAWNGSGSITIDRIGRGTTHVKNVCMALFGGIQPAKLMGYLKAATEFDNDGFVQRLQLAVFPDKPKWGYIDEFPDKTARDTAFKVIKDVAQSDFSALCYQANEFDPFPHTRFDPQAQEIFRDWLTRWETQLLPAESGLLLEHFTKYRSLMPSLALIFHVLHYADGLTSSDKSGKHLVSAQAVSMAINWCEYLQSHARRIYGLMDTLSITGAKELLHHLKKGDLNDEFKARDISRKQWSFLNNTEQVDLAILELLERGWLQMDQKPAPPTGRPESPSYRIHPIILSKRPE